MKTYIFTLLISALVNPSSYFAHIPSFRYTLEEEANVSDLDFETSNVVYALATEMATEAYIDDIPFNTEVVAMSLGTRLPEEEYVDDIPFNTYEVAVNKKVNLPEEAYVDDIPFDTECIVNNRHMRKGLIGKCLINKDREPTSSLSINSDSLHEFAMKHGPWELK